MWSSPVTRRLCLLLASLVPLVTTVSSCDDSTTVVDCIVGAHHPAGREDICVPDPVPPSTRHTLLAAARRAAEENHGALTKAVAVEADRRNAARYTTGATVTGGGLVWVVQVAGRFQCGSACFGSPSRGSPRGTVLTILIDTTTFEVSGLTLTGRWLNLSHLGIVVVLQR